MVADVISAFTMEPVSKPGTILARQASVAARGADSAIGGNPGIPEVSGGQGSMGPTEISLLREFLELLDAWDRNENNQSDSVAA